MKLAVCIAMIFLFDQALAIPTWIRVYGGPKVEAGFSVCETDDGGFIVAGEAPPSGSPLLYLLRVDSLGDTLWSKKYGNQHWSQQGWCIQPVKDGGYIVVGTRSPDFGFEDIWLLRITEEGDTLWTRSLGRPGASDEGYSVSPTRDGGYIISGWTDSYFPGGVCLVKTDSVGNLQFMKGYTGGEYDYGFSVLEDDKGCFVVAGSLNLKGDLSGHIYLMRTDSLGNTLWYKIYGGASEEGTHCIRKTYDGGFIVGGWTRSFSRHSPHADIWLLKTDANGDTLWTKRFSATLDAEAYSVVQTPDSGYALIGYGENSKDYRFVFLLKTDSRGDSLWSKQFGGPGADYGLDLKRTRDGGFIICGTTYSYGNDDQLYLIKTDSLGNVGVGETDTRPPVRRLECSIVPNPAHSKLDITFNPPVRGPAILTIYDALGACVLKKDRWQGGHPSIDIRDFAAGVYFLTIKTVAGTVDKKITVVK